jgi:hypothetical protein
MREDAERIIFVLLALIAPSAAALLLIKAEPAENWNAFGVIALNVALVFGPVFYGLAFCALPPRARLPWKILALVWPLVASAAMGCLSIGYFDWANVLTGSQQEVLVAGRVRATSFRGMDTRGKTSYRTGHTTYLVTIEFQDKPKELFINREEYLKLKAGDYYGRSMQRGGLGYYYEWMWDWAAHKNNAEPLQRKQGTFPAP